MSLERFERCLNVTLGFEGGYSKDPSDAGGATNLGIEFKEYNAWLKQHGKPAVSLNDFQHSLKPVDVEPLYLENYWQQVTDGSLPAPVDMVAFDTAVLQGVGKAKRFLSETASINDPVVRAYDMLQRRADDFRSIVQNNPVDRKFLPGWLNRVSLLKTLIQHKQI